MARGWRLPIWSCQQNSDSKQAGGFYSQAVSMLWVLRSLEAESENTSVLSPFVIQGIGCEMIFHE